MKFILYKEKIAGPHEDLMAYKSPYDRHYYLDSFADSLTFQQVLKKEKDYVREIDVPVLDLEQTFNVMGNEELDPEKFEFVEESDVDITIRFIETGEEFKIPSIYVRTKAEKRQVIATKLITPYRGNFKSDFQEDWVDFTLKYKVKVTGDRLIQMFIVNEEMLTDFNNLLTKESQILPVRIDSGFFYNLYLEKIEYQPLNK